MHFLNLKENKTRGVAKLFKEILSRLILFAALCSQINISVQAAEKKKIVFLVGDDIRHPSGTHEFFAGAKLLKKSFEASPVASQLDYAIVNNWPEDTSVFNDADVIVHYYQGNKSHFMNDHHLLIDKLASRGVGQIFMHYAVDPEKVAEEYIKKWTGAVYKTGYSSNPHWFLKAKLEKHPINKGVSQLEIQDEWYIKMDYECDCSIDHNGQLENEKVHAVMSGVPSVSKDINRLNKRLEKGERKPADLTVFWAKERADGGRGAGFTGGHFHKNWANDTFRKQIMNAIVWCAGMEVPKDGVSSPRITETEINENLDKRKPRFQRISLSSEERKK